MIEGFASIQDFLLHHVLRESEEQSFLALHKAVSFLVEKDTSLDVIDAELEEIATKLYVMRRTDLNGVVNDVHECLHGYAYPEI